VFLNFGHCTVLLAAGNAEDRKSLLL
jgi:hypothetical protein